MPSKREKPSARDEKDEALLIDCASLHASIAPFAVGPQR